MKTNKEPLFSGFRTENLKELERGTVTRKNSKPLISAPKWELVSPVTKGRESAIFGAGSQK